MTYQIAKQINASTRFTSYALYNVFNHGKVGVGSYTSLAAAKRAAKELLMKGDKLTIGNAETYSLYA